MRPNLARIARECGVSRFFVRKIESELLRFDSVIDLDIERATRERTLGPGAFTIDSLDVYLIVRLYEEEPCRRLDNYRENLSMMTGSDVSISTISYFFLRCIRIP